MAKDFSSLGTNLSAERVRNWMLSLREQAKPGIQRVLIREGNRLAAAQRSRARSRRIAATIKVTFGREETGFVRTNLQGQTVYAEHAGFRAANKGDRSGATGRFVNDMVVTVTAGGPGSTKSVVRGQSPFYDIAFAFELGTRRMARIPFFYPPWRSMRASIQQNIERAMYDAVVFAGNRAGTFL